MSMGSILKHFPRKVIVMKSPALRAEVALLGGTPEDDSNFLAAAHFSSMDLSRPPPARMTRAFRDRRRSPGLHGIFHIATARRRLPAQLRCPESARRTPSIRCQPGRHSRRDSHESLPLDDRSPSDVHEVNPMTMVRVLSSMKRVGPQSVAMNFRMPIARAAQNAVDEEIERVLTCVVPIVGADARGKAYVMGSAVANV